MFKDLPFPLCKMMLAERKRSLFLSHDVSIVCAFNSIVSVTLVSIYSFEADLLFLFHKIIIPCAVGFTLYPVSICSQVRRRAGDVLGRAL